MTSEQVALILGITRHGRAVRQFGVRSKEGERTLRSNRPRPPPPPEISPKHAGRAVLCKHRTAYRGASTQ